MLCCIFAHLGLLDLYHSSLVSSYLIFSHEGQLERPDGHVYLFEESLNSLSGYSSICNWEPLCCGPPISTRLEEFNRRQNAWRYLRLNLYTTEYPGTGYGAKMYEYLGLNVFSFGPWRLTVDVIYSTSLVEPR